MSSRRELSTDVLIIGGGPAGLSAAAALAPRLDGEVWVIEREPAAGGIPRHCGHLGFGMRDLRTFVSGPAYARRLMAAALRAGARIRTGSMVTGWAEGRVAEVTSSGGLERISARVIVLATGARERPRTARLVAGDRPAGVYTTGQLQDLVHLHHRSSGKRAVIVGSELVSWSAALTLRHAGCRPLLMATEHQRPEVYRALATAGRLALRVPVETRTRISEIVGRGRVEAVELERIDTGARRRVVCDAVVFTGDWIPDSELARAAGLQIDPQTLGPLIDTAQATSAAGVFAIGNLVHPADTADVAALDGRAVAAAVHAYLTAGHAYLNAGQPHLTAGHAQSGPRLLPGANLSWITPGALRPGAPAPSGRLSCRPRRDILLPAATVSQGGGIITRRRLPWPASPGRVYRIPSSLLSGVDSAGPAVIVDLDRADRLSRQSLRSR